MSQIIYRPVDSQPEKPINLSTTMDKTVPVTMAPTIASNGIGAAIPPRLETGLSGAVDLTTVKPAQTVVAMNGSTAEVVTAVIKEDDGKPVDLTAGRRAACCDVVYKLPLQAAVQLSSPQLHYQRIALATEMTIINTIVLLMVWEVWVALNPQCRHKLGRGWSLLI